LLWSQSAFKTFISMHGGNSTGCAARQRHMPVHGSEGLIKVWSTYGLGRFEV